MMNIIYVEPEPQIKSDLNLVLLKFDCNYKVHAWRIRCDKDGCKASHSPLLSPLPFIISINFNHNFCCIIIFSSFLSMKTNWSRTKRRSDAGYHEENWLSSTVQLLMTFLIASIWLQRILWSRNTTDNDLSAVARHAELAIICRHKRERLSGDNLITR